MSTSLLIRIHPLRNIPYWMVHYNIISWKWNVLKKWMIHFCRYLIMRISISIGFDWITNGRSRNVQREELSQTTDSDEKEEQCEISEVFFETFDFSIENSTKRWREMCCGIRCWWMPKILQERLKWTQHQMDLVRFCTRLCLTHRMHWRNDSDGCLM